MIGVVGGEGRPGRMHRTSLYAVAVLTTLSFLVAVSMKSAIWYSREKISECAKAKR